MNNNYKATQHSRSKSQAKEDLILTNYNKNTNKFSNYINEDLQ